VKRLIRDGFTAESATLSPGNDIVVVARAGSGEFAEREGLDGVRRELSALLDEAGARLEG
jgi:RNase P protein component